MNGSQRREAIFGGWDGVVSVIGFVFGLLVHRAGLSAVAVGGLGGAVSATISMSTGAYESAEGSRTARFGDATAMGVATLAGSLIPVWPFFVFDRTWAVLVGAVGAGMVAGWIGWEKHAGWRGLAVTCGTLLAAVGVTVGIVWAIPQSG